MPPAWVRRRAVRHERLHTRSVKLGSADGQINSPAWNDGRRFRLTDVSGTRTRRHLGRGFDDPLHRLAAHSACAGENARRGGNVVPLAEWREVQHDVQAVIQVLRKLPTRISSSSHGSSPRRACRLESRRWIPRDGFAMLERAQRLHLRRRRRLADLVEEERSFRRRREQTHLVAHRAGEQPFMAEATLETTLPAAHRS